MDKKTTHTKNIKSDALATDLTLMEVKKIGAMLTSHFENDAKREAQLAKYQAEPINVIPVKDIDKTMNVEGVVKRLDRIDDAIVTICSHFVDFDNKQEEFTDSMNVIEKWLFPTIRKNPNFEEFVNDLVHPREPEPRNWYERLSLWWDKESTRRKRLKICAWVFMAGVLINTLFFVYLTRWSDYAWSKRAYDAVIELCPDDPRNPGIVFHNVMQSFKEEKRGEVIDLVLGVEKELKEKREIESGK